jgi:hypothetical protein
VDSGMKVSLRLFLAVAALSLSQFADAQPNIYSKFSPVTGVLKGSATSYFTTAAVSSDIRGLWTGTCDATTFLRGDGACITPAGTGITFSMPGGFTVLGSPGSTISVTTALSGVLKGNGSAFTTAVAADIYGLWSGTCNATTFLQGNGACGQVSLTTQVTGTLGVTNGGEGLNTATLGDLRYGSGSNTLAALAGNTTSTKKYLTQTGTGSVSAAPAWDTIASADVISGWTGSCSSSTFLRGDGTCANSGSSLIVSTSGGVSAAGMAIGQQVYVTKSSTTSRSSTTTLSNDPDLQITNIPAGTYNVTANFAVICGNTTMGIQWNMNTSGGGLFTAKPVLFATSQTTVSETANASLCLNSIINQFVISGQMTTTSSGTLGFSWAQQTSDAGSLTVSVPSYISLLRIN